MPEMLPLGAAPRRRISAGGAERGAHLVMIKPPQPMARNERHEAVPKKKEAPPPPRPAATRSKGSSRNAAISAKVVWRMRKRQGVQHARGLPARGDIAPKV